MPLIRVSTRSGAIEVHAGGSGDVAVESGGRLESLASGEYRIVPSSPSKRVVIRCPEPCDLIAGSASGDIDLYGRLGNVRVTTASGSIRLGEAAKADLRTASGRAQVESCDRLRIQSGSGDISVSRAGELEITVASGKVEVGEAERAHVRSANAPVSLCVRGDTSVETISGKVRVSVPSGLCPDVKCRSLSGKKHTECPAGEDLQIRVQTISGDIEVVEA